MQGFQPYNGAVDFRLPCRISVKAGATLGSVLHEVLVGKSGYAEVSGWDDETLLCAQQHDLQQGA